MREYLNIYYRTLCWRTTGVSAAQGGRYPGRRNVQADKVKELLTENECEYGNPASYRIDKMERIIISRLPFVLVKLSLPALLLLKAK